MSTTEEPVPGSPWPTAPPGAPGLKIGFPEARKHISPKHRVSHREMILLLSGGLGVLALLLVLVAVLATPGPPAKCAVLACQGPPIRHPGKDNPVQAAHGPAVLSGTLYTNAQGFSLLYPPQPTVATDAGGIALTYNFVHGGTAAIEVLGGPVSGATAESAVVAFATQEFPNAEPVYELPDPLIGYQPAFGEAFNVQPASSDGSTQTDRVLLAASVENGFAIVVLTYGSLLPAVTPKSAFFDGHPSPANLNMAYFGGDQIVNSIRFP